MADKDQTIGAIREAAQPLRGGAGDYDTLVDRVGDARFVLLGEATHGTHEFYRARTAITERLIREKDFNAVAVEADWPDAYRVNRFVRGLGADAEAGEALDDFIRFPLWMWRNREIVELIERLRALNERRVPEARVGFYGLDLYSLYRSIAKVLEYLDRVDPEGAERARARYLCFDHRLQDAQQYGFETSLGIRPECEEQALAQLFALQRDAAAYVERNGLAAADERFHAEQNARVIRNAEAYYRGMFSPGVNTWNLRDRHMADTLDALAGHLARPGREARIVIWAHNSHAGDARATDRARLGELNLGQLARARHGARAVLIGFTTHAGTVAAASEWDGPVARKPVQPSRPGSVEHLLHAAGEARFYLPLGAGPARDALREPRLERAIGVIYLPETELASHYFYARLPDQFDAVLHFDHSLALTPLDRVDAWAREEAPETYPFGE